jgi:predicted Zn-dependent protease
LNPENYVVAYCMAKIYLQAYDYENAFKYSLESCKCNRGKWVPFALLACVYMCQKKIHKATVVIDELIKKYPDETLLYYVRAYIEANKILLDVEHDEEVEAAKTMDE